jgi:hypothetical protein
MKTLYESILDRTKDKVQNTKAVVDKLRYFGGQFKFTTKMGLFRGGDMSIISIKALDRLTKRMEFKNPDTKKLMDDGFIWHSDKVEMFIKWLENLDISEFGDVDVNNNVELGKMCEYIKKKMFDDGLFNKPQIIQVRFLRADMYNGFYISIHKKTEYSRLSFHFDKID